MNSGLATKRSFVLVLGLLTGMTAISLDMSLPAIPAMVIDLGTNMSLGQQIIGLFLAGIAVGQLPVGLLADRMGRMPVLYAGLTLFVVAGVVASTSDNINVLLAARFAQGLGSSVGMVLPRAIVRDVASGSQAARLLSLIVMIFTAGPMFAPMLGSFLATQWDWRSPLYALVVIGLIALFGIRAALQETHVASKEHHILRHLWLSVKEFFTHRQSLFGILLIVLAASGFMALISSSAGLIIEIYGYQVKNFGFIFALTGVAILLGSMLNRRLLLRFRPMQLIGVGCSIIGLAASQLLFMAWLGDAHFWWLWASACLYMFGTGFLMPNATALALDPVAKIAGVASSIIGTLQGLGASSSAIVSGMLYDGTINNVTIIMGTAGMATFGAFILRSLILGRAPLYEQKD